jgi:hypothetical protein
MIRFEDCEQVHVLFWFVDKDLEVTGGGREEDSTTEKCLPIHTHSLM